MTCEKDSGMYIRPGSELKAAKRMESDRLNFDAGIRSGSFEDTHGYERKKPSSPRGFNTSHEFHESSKCHGVDVLLLHGERSIWDRIAQAISKKGWTYNSLSSFSALQDALTNDVKVILIDAAFLPALDLQPRWLHSQRHSQTALFILSEHCDIGTRIRAHQTGARKLFLEPIDPDALIHEIEVHIEPKAELGFRTLIVADDEFVAAPAANILQNETINTLILTDPLSIIDTIWHFQPDLILIMESHSTDVDGTILTKLIREREESAAVPIILLSHDYNPENALQALRAGADDVLSLSMYTQWLTTVVSCRVERAKAISAAGIHTTKRHPIELPDRTSMHARIEQAFRQQAEDVWQHAIIVIALDSQHGTSWIPIESSVNHLITMTTEGLGPILQLKDFIARIGKGHLALLVRRNGKDALKQLADLVTEIINYRLTLKQLPVNAFGIGMVMLNDCAQSAEALLKQGELKANTDYLQKRNRYYTETNSSTQSGEKVKERTAWLKEEFMRAIDAGTTTFRERRFVCSNRKVPQIETIELKPEFDLPGSPVDIYQQAALCGASAEFDRFICELGIERLYDYTVRGKQIRLIIRQSPAVLEIWDYIESIKSTLRKLQIVGNGLVLEFVLPALATRLRQAIALFDEVTMLGIGISLSHFPCNESGFKALAHLKADIVRPRPSCLHGETDSIQETAHKIHSRNVEIILPYNETFEEYSPKWREHADYIQDDGPRLELLQGELRGDTPLGRSDRANPFWIV